MTILVATDDGCFSLRYLSGRADAHKVLPRWRVLLMDPCTLMQSIKPDKVVDSRIRLYICSEVDYLPLLMQIQPVEPIQGVGRVTRRLGDRSYVRICCVLYYVPGT